jgi:hypothetical protein
MNENILADHIEEPRALGVPKAFQTIVYGGLTIGVLDGIAAVTNTFIRSGVGPDRVFQYIASAVLGREASNAGGAATIALGVVMHFCVAFGVATGFYVLSLRFPALIRYALIAGPVYGGFVYFVMAYLLVPLTKVQQGQFNLTGMMTGILIHMLCVGLPAALWARHSAKVNNMQ